MLAMEYRTHFDTFTGNAIVFTNRDETRESFFLLLVWEGRRRCSLVCLPRTVSFVKYAVNCVVVCVMSSFAVCLSKLPSLNHPRISDFTSSELQKTNLKTVFSTSNIILLAIKSVNPSAWGHLNPSSYCDVGRLFYGVFKLWSKLQRKKWRNNF